MCLGLGKQGCGLCLLSIPIKLAEPLGGFCWFVVNSAAMRTRVVEKYNINDKNSCCCFTIPTFCVGKISLVMLLDLLSDVCMNGFNVL